MVRISIATGPSLISGESAAGMVRRQPAVMAYGTQETKISCSADLPQPIGEISAFF